MQKGEKPSPEDIETLPENIKKYIIALERELDSLQSSLNVTSDRLRRANFARWKS